MPACCNSEVKGLLPAAAAGDGSRGLGPDVGGFLRSSRLRRLLGDFLS